MKFKQILIIILVSIILTVGSVFVYETFFRKDDDSKTKLEQLESKVSEYEKEISGYKDEMSRRQKSIDSLTFVKQTLVHQNDSLKKQVKKYKDKRNEAVTNIDTVNVDELFKLFSDYKTH